MNLVFKKLLKGRYGLSVSIGVLGLTLFCGMLMTQQARGFDFGVTVGGTVITIGPPIIIRSENITTNTLDLVVEVENAYAGVSLDFSLQVRDMFTGSLTNVNYTQVTDVGARTSLAVGGLMPGTEYQFIVQYTPDGLVYSEQSLPHAAITVIDPPILENIQDIEEEALKLLAQIDSDFINSTMDFIVEIHSGGTYTVQLTQYVTSQYVVLPIDSLESGEDYTFRIKYARENTLNFSEYSNEKSITTDLIEKEGLEAPVIVYIRDITTNSMDLVIEVDGRAGEKLDFIVHRRSIATGRIVVVEFAKIVSEDGMVVFHVGGLNPNTEYEFKVKYSPEDTSDYSNYSDPKRGRTKGFTPDEVLICYDERVISVARSDLQEYINDGAIEGVCVVDSENIQVEICYNEETMLVPQDDLQEYLDNGATRSRCNINEEEVEVCYEDETIWVKLTSQIYQDAKPGKCRDVIVVNEEDEKFYQGTAVIGIGAGVVIATATSAVPMFVAMPGAVSSVVTLQLLRIFGIIGPRRRKKGWSMIFERKTHLPIPAVKIVLLDSNAEKIATTYSDEDGRFGFTVDPGEYSLNISKKRYTLITDLENDSLYDMVYDGRAITVDDDRTMKTINVAMSAKNIDWEKYAVTRSSQYISFLSRARKSFFAILYVLGFCATLLATYVYPGLWNIVALGIYVLLLVFTLFLKKRVYGTIQTTSGRPVPFAIVNLYDNIFNKRQSFAVTDSIGRYYLRIDNGSYNLEARSQRIGGAEFNKKEDIFIKDGIVRNKIII